MGRAFLQAVLPAIVVQNIRARAWRAVCRDPQSRGIYGNATLTRLDGRQTAARAIKGGREPESPGFAGFSASPALMGP